MEILKIRKMKLPSITNLLQGARNTFKRFPFVILVSALAAFIMILFAEGINNPESVLFYKLLNAAMAASLGIPLLFSVSIFSENYEFSKKSSLGLQSLVVLLLIVYYFTLSHHESYYDGVRYFLFLVSVHLLVSFSLFKRDKGESVFTSFWDFNLSLFMRFLVAAFYSLVLYAGLSIALLSFDKLFDIQLKGIRYMQLFYLLAGVFNTWFFLSDIPGKDENINPFPKSIKIFTQYVAIPIVLIYLLILYMYMGKIVLQWQLPVGWVSNLIIGFSIAGIFSLLLIHPLKNTEGNGWIKKFSKAFYFILIPLIALLFIAITRRTSEYGITEPRYFVFVTALWLSGITLYFIISRTKNIKIIPVSLFLIALLTSVGPWGAFQLSLNNQVSRLEELLIKNKILVEGKIIKASIQPDSEELANIYSVVEYLHVRKMYSEIQPWFNVALDTLTSGEGKLGKFLTTESKIMELMGIEYHPVYSKMTKGHFEQSFNFVNPLDVSGFEYLYDYYIYSKTDTTLKTAANAYKIILDNNTSNVLMLYSKDSLKTYSDTLVFTSKNIYEKLKSVQNKDYVSVDAEGKLFKSRMVITQISGDTKNETLIIERLSCKFLISRKKTE